jgi:purine nucleosidase
MQRIPPAAISLIFLALGVLGGSGAIAHAEPHMVIADQDAMGPGGSDMRALMVFLQSPDVNLLGITVVIGDGWRDEEVAHALRLLELLGRTDIRVYPGATHPLWRTREWTRLASQMYGKAVWEGAWRRQRRSRSSAQGGRSLDQTSRGKRRAFHDPHGASVSSSGHDLWRRAADEYSPGD